MPRSPRNEIAVQDFARHIVKVHRRAGSPKPKEIELWIHRQFDHHVSEESIRKAITGTVDPMGCDVELITGLAAFFGVSPSEFGTFAEARVAHVLAMASAIDRGPTGPASAADRRRRRDHRNPPSSWNADSDDVLNFPGQGPIHSAAPVAA